MKFKKEDLIELEGIYCISEYPDTTKHISSHTTDDGKLLTKISCEFIEKSRWCDIYEMIFKWNDQYFSSTKYNISY